MKDKCMGIWRSVRPVAMLLGGFLAVELFAWLILLPWEWSPLLFGFLWSLLLGTFCVFLPRKAGRIVFGILYYLATFWTLAQTLNAVPKCSTSSE